MLFKTKRSFAQTLEEIPVRFVSPETLANVVPVILLSILAALLDRAILSEFWLPLRVLWWLFVQSLLVGRFTLGALNGRLHADLFESFPWFQLPGFCIRYMLIGALWVFPLGAIILSLTPIEAIQNAGLLEWLIHSVYLAGSQPFTPDVLFWLLLIAISGTAILPTYAAIVAAQAKTPLHIFFPTTWIHPLRAKTDLISMFISFLGGLLFPLILYLPLLGGAAMLTYLLSPTLGKLIAALSMAVPLMSWSILSGRLAGTFALYHPRNPEDEIQLIDEDAITLPPQITPAAVPPITQSIANLEPQVSHLKTAPVSTPRAQKPIEPSIDVPVEKQADAIDDPLSQEVHAILAQSEADASSALAQILALRRKHPLAPIVLAAEVSILVRMGQKQQAMGTAPAALKALAHMGKYNDAAQLFLSFGKDRHRIDLDHESLELLGKAFLSIKDFREAGWCIHTSEVIQGQSERAGKRLIQVADAANAAKQLESATALLKYYLKNHPDGPLADYARKALEYNLKQLQDAS